LSDILAEARRKTVGLCAADNIDTPPDTNATAKEEESLRRQCGAIRLSLAVAIHNPSGSVELAEPGNPATLFRLRGT
jgi:hypothetical protein